MIKIKNLTKSYDSRKYVIDNMNLEFSDCGLNIVVGKSGCGKTTLLNLLGTMDYKYNGTIEVNGRILSKLSYKELCNYKNFYTSFIFQKDSLFEELSVKDNIKIILDLQGEEINISELLEKVDLKGFEDKKVKYLSGGEKQRVSIARALAKKSEIIFADEPTSALDSKNAHRIFKLLHEISKEKLVIIVTHDTKKAFQYADRIIHLHDGQVIKIEEKEEQKNSLVLPKYNKGNRCSLLPLFKYQFTKGFFVNIFVVLLLSLVTMLMIVSNEEQKVLDEYNAEAYKYGIVYSDEDDELLANDIEDEINQNISYQKRTTNVMRFLTTLTANKIDFWKLSKIEDELSPFTYLEEISQRKSELTYLEYLELQPYFNNTYLNETNSSKLYIRGISTPHVYEITATSSSDGVAHYYYSMEEVDYEYFNYDQNNNYKLLFGRLPENENEILITDTIADKYLRSLKLYENDLSDIIGMDMEINESFYSIENNNEAFYYRDLNYDTLDLVNVPVNYIEKHYKVIGVIDTNYLDYYTYSITTDTYDFKFDIKEPFEFTTLRDVEYMNHNYNKPYGYIIFYNHDNILRNTYNLYDVLKFDNLDYDGFSLTKSDISTFHGYLDYKNINSYEDNLNIDHDNRILIKDINNDNLEHNQIIATPSFLLDVFPSYNTTSEMIANFNSINGTKINISFNRNDKVVNKNLEIVGIAQNKENISFYVSDELLNEINKETIANTDYSLTVDLNGFDEKERYDLMIDLFQKGYILSPINIMPGAYMEFVEGAGKMVGTDDEGISETINISIYHLFSKYYNNDKMLGSNNFLSIISNISLFSLIMGLLISIGFIYLKERKQKLMIIKLSTIGVKAKTIILMQLISYILMAILVGIFSYLFACIFIDYINSSFIIDFEVVKIYRYRLLVSQNAINYSLIAFMITLIIGLISSIIVVYKFKK